MMVAMIPDYKLDIVQYATTLIFELYRKGDGMLVKTLYLGEPLKFEECDNNEYCSFENWFKHMDNNLVTDSNDLKKQCARTAEDYQF